MASNEFSITILGFDDFMEVIQALIDEEDNLPPRVVIALELFQEKALRNFQ